MPDSRAPRSGRSHLREARPGRLALLALVIGALVSIGAAAAWRAQAQHQVIRSLSTEAAGVDDAVITSLRRMDDVTAVARALFDTDRELSNRSFNGWYRGIGAAQRYPGMLGFGFISFVARPQLPRFLAEVRRDPLPGIGAGHVTVTPPGRRPEYCLLRYVVRGEINALLTPGLDLCRIPGFDSLARVRDSGAYSSLTLGGRIIAVFAPVYRGGVTPPTVEGRRAAALGIVAEMFDARSLIQTAMARHRDLEISISRRDRLPSSQTGGGLAGRFTSAVGDVSDLVSVGAVDHPALTSRTDFQADGRWLVTVSAAASATGLHPDRQALMVFLALLVVSGLTASLIQALSQGRLHALKMVHERTQQLRHMAMHDALTGLPNRALLMERAESLLDQRVEDGRWIAAMYLDLDGFKGVNDSLGHAAGDRLLQAAGRRIAGSLRSSDVVGRMGGDEFVVIAAGRPGEHGPEQLAERLQAAFREPFSLGEGSATTVTVTTSVGLAIGPRWTAEDLLRDADIALYQAKQQGRNRCVVFRRNMQVALQERVEMENELRGALARGELRVAYQPIFDLHDGRAVGVEALMRWDHPVRGPVPPGVFAPIAEDSDLIVELGDWALAEACRQCAAWHRHGRELYVSVNVAARQLQDPGLVESVRHCLRSSGLEPEYLMLEITETAIMRDSEAAAGRVAAISALGVRIAIDDFGTGYSSLAYLHSFDADALKIDRTFVADIGSSRDAEALIGTLIGLAHSLGIEPVAEAIESEAQKEFLVAHGCRLGQGFLFARPLRPRELETRLAIAAGSALAARGALRARD